MSEVEKKNVEAPAAPSPAPTPSAPSPAPTPAASAGAAPSETQKQSQSSRPVTPPPQQERKLPRRPASRRRTFQSIIDAKATAAYEKIADGEVRRVKETIVPRIKREIEKEAELGMFYMFIDKTKLMVGNEERDYLILHYPNVDRVLEAKIKIRANLVNEELKSELNGLKSSSSHDKGFLTGLDVSWT